MGSDMTDMVGGDLQVLQVANGSGHVFDDFKANGVPAHLIETVKYPGAGYCIVMQGSHILHKVTAVKEGREQRISLVNSWGRRDVFAPDKTRFKTFLDISLDPPDVAHLEFARHKAWRCAGKMQHVIEDLPFGTTPAQLAEVMQEAALELIQTSRLLRGEASDHDSSNKVWLDGDKTELMEVRASGNDSSNDSWADNKSRKRKRTAALMETWGTAACMIEKAVGA